MKINIIGSLLGTSGYDNHTKGLANALYKLNPDIKLDVPLCPGWEQLVNDAELAMIKNPHQDPDVTIMIATPPFWRIGLGDNCGKFIGYCIWEGDRIPKYWIEYLEDKRISQIWVPSQHTKTAILNTLKCGDFPGEYFKKVRDKIKIVPHGYDPEVFKQIETKKYDTFKIISNKGWRGGMEDRGGVQYLLQAYANEFKKDEDVELLLKLNPAYINPQTVSQKIDKLKLPKDAAKIKIACANMSQKQICDLYNQSDLYVCATRAESFDLGTAEAMACGLPIITTGYGGQTEHIGTGCGAFIDYELQEVKGDLMYEGVKQAVPNTQHLQKLLRAAFLHRDRTREKGANAKKFISSWTWDSSAEKGMNFIKELK